MKLSNLKHAAKIAYEKGYRINENGECINPKGRVLKCSLGNNGYKFTGKPIFRIYQLAAYQKFGEKWLYSDLFVRHLDNNKLNNKLENIEIGTRQDNVDDYLTDIKLEELRKEFLKRRSCPKFQEKRIKACRIKRAKCSDEKVFEILHFYYVSCNQSIKLTKLGEKFGLARDDVDRIVRGRLYKDVYLNFMKDFVDFRSE